MSHKLKMDSGDVTLEQALQQPYLYALYTPNVIPADDHAGLRNRMGEFLSHADDVTRRGEAQLAYLMSRLIPTNEHRGPVVAGECDPVAPPLRPPRTPQRRVQTCRAYVHRFSCAPNPALLLPPPLLSPP